MCVDRLGDRMGDKKKRKIEREQPRITIRYGPHVTLKGWILTGQSNVNKNKIPFMAVYETNLKRELTLKIQLRK